MTNGIQNTQHGKANSTMNAITPKPGADQDARPAVIPLTMTVTLTAPARRRTDMEGVYTVELVSGGKAVTRRHYRATGPADAPVLTDETEAIAEELRTRARAASDVIAAAQADRVKADEASRSTKRQGQLQREETMQAGVYRSRRLTALDTLEQRCLLTMGQMEAGQRLAELAKQASGERDAPEGDGAGQELNLGGRSWEDFIVTARRELDRIRTAVKAVPAFEGVNPWDAVEAIVIRDTALTDFAGSKSQSVVRRYKAALRIGLDAVGEGLGLRGAEWLRLTVGGQKAGGGFVTGLVVYVEDLDGRDHEAKGGNKLRRVYRTLTLNNQPWVTVAAKLDGVQQAATEILLSGSK